MDRRRVVFCLAVIASLWCARTAAAQAPPPQRTRCDVCHSETEFLRQHTDSMARARLINVSDTTIAKSAHAKLTCPSCHEGFGGFPHKAGATRKCQTCHTAERDAWTRGAHMPQEGKAGAECTQCHGVHDVRSRDVLHTSAGMSAMNRNCASCHQQEKLDARSPHAGKVLCASCHGAHDTEPAANRESRLWANQQLQTCGTCHEKITSSWSTQDVHAQVLLTRRSQGGKGITRRAPACTDCHGAHGMVVSPDSTLEQAGSTRCEECHSSTAGHYADSYHGQANRLGSKKAATCADCHSAHTIQRANVATSTVAKANLARTCGRCHKTATASFTSFDPHVDHKDKSNPLVYWTFKFMSLLLAGTLSFFGLHTALWLIRLNLDARARGRDR